MVIEEAIIYVLYWNFLILFNKFCITYNNFFSIKKIDTANALIQMAGKCEFSFGYSFNDSGLTGGDYEFDPYVAYWLTYDDYNREAIDNCVFDKSRIKQLLSKGENLERKAKGSHYGKKVMKKYKEEKKGFKDYKKERAARKADRDKSKSKSKSKSKKGSKSKKKSQKKKPKSKKTK